MEIATLVQMVALARTRENRAAAELRSGLTALQRAKAMNAQLEEFGFEYRHAALNVQAGAQGVSYVTDAFAFGQRLHATSYQQQAAIAEQGERCQALQRALIQVQHRSTILQKMLDKELREQRLTVERRADREVEEVINSRLSR